jgi:protein SCO1/2
VKDDDAPKDRHPPANLDSLRHGDHEPSRWRALARNPWLWATVFGLIAIPAMRPLLVFEPPPPPVFYDLPAFSLLDLEGKTFGSRQLEGRVYVASFLFTRCTTICPAIAAALRRLDQRYREEGIEGIDIVSFSVDPAYDSPEVLGRYAERQGIDTRRWHLLTGPEETIRRLIVDGFKTPMGSPETIGPGLDIVENRSSHADHGGEAPAESAEPTLIDIAHTGRLVLVDRQGGVRGYYDISEQGLDEIFHRSRHVLAERRPPRARRIDPSAGSRTAPSP